jgi:hypothetical protein
VSKGISLHIGINKYLPGRYPTAAPLQSAENDAIKMHEIAVERGYLAVNGRNNLLLGKDATVQTFLDYVHAAQQELNAGGGAFFLSFSGHGSQKLDEDQDASGPGITDAGPDEEWCLYDYPLLDDVLYGLLSQFDPGVNIFLVVDACHSGGPVTGGNGAIMLSLERVLSRATGQSLSSPLAILPPKSAKAKQRSNGYSKTADALGSFAAPQSRQSAAAFGVKKVAKPERTFVMPEIAKLEKLFTDRNRQPLRAGLAFLAACADNFDTFDGVDDHHFSVYTQAFVDALASSPASIAELASLIPTKIPSGIPVAPQFRFMLREPTTIKPLAF